MNEKRSSSTSCDDPPNSRLFIIGPKTLTEEDYRAAFNRFGVIEELWCVKDRNTGENKGVTYIKYSKTSEAAKAMETMNSKSLIEGTRHIKIMIAASREQGSKRESNEEERTQRLFVMVPKSMTDGELYSSFKQFGDIEYASIIKDRNTKENKGFAYVKFNKFLDAAIAYEQCDRKYKPVFAEPRKSNLSKSEERHNVSHSNDSIHRSSTSFSGSSLAIPTPAVSYNEDSYVRLKVIASPMINQDQLWKLFDIIPGLDYCQVRYEGEASRPVRALGEVVYTHPKWAAHAKEKLHGFEYPPGYRLIVKPEYDCNSRALEKNKPDILQIAETIAQATSLIHAAGLSPDILQARLGIGSSVPKENDTYCSVHLPERQPLANIDEEMAARCFIVCTPSALPSSVLKDIFCRFGNLIEAYMLNNRNCGYARYASKQSAQNAIQTLHGADVLGVRLKVIKAEDRPDHQRKRQRTEENW